MDSATNLVWFGRIGIDWLRLLMDDIKCTHDVQSCYVASSYNTNDGKSGCMSIIEVLEDG